MAQEQAPAKAHAEGQQHPIGIYLKIWALLFVLSAGSYFVDYANIEGYLRWFLILLFMILKAGLIVAVFMHMLWERLALLYAIIVPPVLPETLCCCSGLPIALSNISRTAATLADAGCSLSCIISLSTLQPSKLIS